MIKKIAVVAGAVLIASTAVLFSPTPGLTSAAPGLHKVTVCHFAGHEGDFVTNNWITAGTPACGNAGGNAIVVAPQGCEQGHAAAALYGRTCYQGENQAGAP